MLSPEDVMPPNAPENGSDSADRCFAEARQRLLLRVQDPVLVRAADALAKNQAAVAEPLVSSYLEKKPRDAKALNLMADIARRANRLEEAERLLGRCVTLSPETQAFRYNFSAVLFRMHKYDEALAQLDALLALDPGNVLYRDQKATQLAATGRQAEALLYRRALAEEFPRSPDMLVRYAHALRDAGFQAECISAYRRTLEIAPAFEAVYSHLASLKTYRFTGDDIEAMERQLTSAPRSAENRAGLHHALGKAYGDLERYGESFDNYARGNALRRIRVDFDMERVTRAAKAAERFFTGEFFRRRAGWGCDSRAPIFIVGLPRSGSTLLEQILSSHGAIEGMGELEDFQTALIRPLAAFRGEIELERLADGNAVDRASLLNAYMQIGDRFDAGQWKRLGESYLQSTGRRRLTQRPFVTDKALVNYFYAGLIHVVLPNARIVDIRRHPLDCGWSCFTSQFPGRHFSLKLGDIGQEYVNYVRLMAHFDRVLPGRIHRVHYEQLVVEPEHELRRLCDYLAVPFEEQCLRFYDNTRALTTQSSQQVRMPLYRSGVGRWRPYEPWLGPLKAALGPILEAYPQVPD